MTRILTASLISLLVGVLLSFTIVNAIHNTENADAIAALQRSVAEKADKHAFKVESTPRRNVRTSFNARVDKARVADSAWLDPSSSVIGDVIIKDNVYIGPFASVRGDEGQPIYIGRDSNIQDGVVLHALETEQDGAPIEGRTHVVNGVAYAVYVGQRVSLAHQSLVHGPAVVEDDVFVGMQAMVFKATVGKGSVIEPGAKVIGVQVPPGRYVSAGRTLTSQAEADRLPVITEGYAFRSLNEAVVHVNTSLAASYGDRSHEDHKAATDDHGEAPAEHGEAPAEHGEAPAEHGEAPAEHGSAGMTPTAGGH